MMDKLYSKKENRDADAKILKSENRRIKKFSVRNQRLHPAYIQDVPSGDTGFGNTEYMTYWKVLYGIKEIE